MPHGSEVARAETVHDPLCRCAQRRDTGWIRDGPAARDHHSIEEGVDDDDDESAGREVIAGDIERHRVDGCGRRRGNRRQFNRGERHHPPWPAVLEDGEIRGRQPANGPALPVEHGDVEVNGVDTGAERLRLRGRELLRGRKGDEYRNPACEQGEDMFHENSPEALAQGLYVVEASATATSLFR